MNRLPRKADTSDVEAPDPMDDQITVYATTWCADCLRARRVLDRNGASYRWIDVDLDPEATAEVIRINRGLRSVPTILFPDGSVMVEPSDRELEAKLAG